MFVYGFQNRHSVRDVWYKNAVHDVNVEPVGFACVYHFDVALQVSKIGSQNRRCNNCIFHCVVVVSRYTAVQLYRVVVSAKLGYLKQTGKIL
jgi:hypothetical protein